MSKRTIYTIISVVLMLACLGSAGGGTFSTVSAVDSNKTYKTKSMSYITYSKLAENATKTKFNLTFFSQQMKEKAAELKEEVDAAKANLTKFAILAGVLYFAAVMALVGFIVILKKIKKEPKHAKEPRKRRQAKKEEQPADEVEENV